MKRNFITAICATLLTLSAQAAPGEYWEITSKMEMPGMPMQMPAMTVKVCVPAGGEKNPQYMQKNDGKCQLSDVKTSGNKVSWKATCNEHGETMVGTGESIHEGNSYRGNMRFTGSSQGHQINMTQTYSGKKIGGACDSEDQVRAIKQKVEAACDASGYNAEAWIANAPMFLKGTCAGKKETLCSTVRRDAARNAKTYQALIETEKHNNAMITSACGLNLESLRVSVCQASKGGNYNFLKANCPAEAKAYMETARKNCAGRSYTARAAAGCSAEGNDEQNTATYDASANTSASASKHTPPESAEAKAREQQGKVMDAIPATGNADVDKVVESAKKLKGLFGF